MKTKKVTANEIEEVHRNRMDYCKLLDIAQRMNVDELKQNENAIAKKQKKKYVQRAPKIVSKNVQQFLAQYDKESIKCEQNNQLEGAEKLKNETKVEKVADGKNSIKPEPKRSIDSDELERKMERIKATLHRDWHRKKRKSICRRIAEACTVPVKRKEDQSRIKAIRDNFLGKQEAIRIKAKNDRERRVREREEAIKRYNNIYN